MSWKNNRISVPKTAWKNVTKKYHHSLTSGTMLPEILNCWKKNHQWVKLSLSEDNYSCFFFLNLQKTFKFLPKMYKFFFMLRYKFGLWIINLNRPHHDFPWHKNYPCTLLLLSSFQFLWRGNSSTSPPTSPQKQKSPTSHHPCTTALQVWTSENALKIL